MRSRKIRSATLAIVLGVGALTVTTGISEVARAEPGTLYVPAPVVQGPIASSGAISGTPRNYPFMATPIDLAARGYVEEEYFISLAPTSGVRHPVRAPTTMPDQGVRSPVRWPTATAATRPGSWCAARCPPRRSTARSCDLFGVHEPYTAEMLRGLCRNQGAYVSAVASVNNDNRRAGYIVDADSEESTRSAAESGVGRR
jgi:hypothetical protein